MKLFKKVSGWKKYYIITILPIMLLVMFYGIYKESTKHDHLSLITKSSNINMHVKTTFKGRDAVIIDDSLIIPYSTRLASNYKNDGLYNLEKSKFDISKVTAPFLLIKDSDSWIIKVVRQNDTLFFKLPDPDKKDLSDPTFTDLYEYIFEIE